MINKEKKSEKIPEKLIKMIKKSGKMKRKKSGKILICIEIFEKNYKKKT